MYAVIETCQKVFEMKRSDSLTEKFRDEYDRGWRNAHKASNTERTRLPLVFREPRGIGADELHAKTARLLGFTKAHAKTILNKPWWLKQRDRVLHVLRNSMGDAALERSMAEGTTLSADEAIDLARTL